MLTLAWTYLRIGLIFFGGGYVLIPLLQHLLVEQYKWLSLREFLDGVAISQLTPGPLAMLATFTGVRVGGFSGGPGGHHLHIPALRRIDAVCGPLLHPAQTD